MSGFGFIKTFDRYSDDTAPAAGVPAARGVWALRVTKFDAGTKIGSSPDNLRTIRALGHYRRKPGPGVEPFEVYVTGNIAFEYVTSPLEFDIFDGALSPQSSTDIGANQVVVGPDAPGAAATGSPVGLGVVDSNGNIVRLKTVSPGSQILAVTLADGGGGQVVSSDGATISRSAMAGGKDPGGLLRALGVDVKGRLLAGEDNRATYVVQNSCLLLAAANVTYLIEAGASKTTRIRRMLIMPGGGAGPTQTTAGWVRFLLGRTTAASSGGSVGAAPPLDPGDSAFSGLHRTGAGALTTTPASFAINGAGVVGSFSIWVPAAGSPSGPLPIDLDFAKLFGKALTIGPGVTNGLAIYQFTAAAGAAGGFDIITYLTEE